MSSEIAVNISNCTDSSSSGCYESLLQENCDLEHPEVVSLFRLPQICEIIRQHSLTPIVLQFPDEELKYCVSVYLFVDRILNGNLALSAKKNHQLDVSVSVSQTGSELSRLLSAQSPSSSQSILHANVVLPASGSLPSSPPPSPPFDLYVVADSSFGSSVDDVSALHVNARACVYFGSDLSSSGTIPLILNPVQRTLCNCETGAARTSSSVGSGRAQCCGVCTRTCAEKLKAQSQLFASPSGGSSGATTQSQTQRRHVCVVCDPSYHSDVVDLVATQFPLLPNCDICVSVGSLPHCADLSHWSLAPQPTLASTAGMMVIGGYSFGHSTVEGTGQQVEDITINPAEIWYIGSKREQLASIFLNHSQIPVVVYDPVLRDVTTVKGSEQREFRERIGGMTKVEKSKVIGLLVGSMGLNQIDSKAILHRLRTLIKAANKKSYTLVCGRLNVAKLSNFPEIDLYCLISNEDAAIVSAKSYHVPVITPYELELGLGALDWNSRFLVNSTSILHTGVDLETAMERVRATRRERGDCSDDEDSDNDDEESVQSKQALNSDMAAIRSLRADYVADASPSSSSAPIGPTSTSIIRKEVPESRVIEFVAHTAAHFQQRSFKGLEASVPTNASTQIVVGQYGIARGYERMKMEEAVRNGFEVDLNNDNNGEEENEDDENEEESEPAVNAGNNEHGNECGSAVCCCK